jgi:hypothetical protein
VKNKSVLGSPVCLECLTSAAPQCCDQTTGNEMSMKRRPIAGAVLQELSFFASE